MTARFEIVRVDGGYFARFVAANNRVVWVTPGLLSRRRTAVAAIAAVARLMSPTDQIWVSNVNNSGTVSADIRYGSGGHSTWTNAHRLEVRDVDLRGEGVGAE